MECPNCGSYNIVHTEVTDIERNGSFIKIEVYNRCECGEAFMTAERYKLEREWLFEK